MEEEKRNEENEEKKEEVETKKGKTKGDPIVEFM